MATAETPTTVAAWREIVPGDVRERRAFARAQHKDRAERHQQAEHELRHHAGAGRGERAERQVAAHGEQERAAAMNTPPAM